MSLAWLGLSDEDILGALHRAATGRAGCASARQVLDELPEEAQRAHSAARSVSGRLVALRTRGLVKAERGYDGAQRYGLTDEGRAFLAKERQA